MKHSSLLLVMTVAVALTACGGGGGGGGGDSAAPPPPPPSAANSPPTIASIGKQTIAQDAVSDPIAIAIGDAQSDAITLAAESSNLELFGEAGFALSGGDAARTLILTPTPGQSGTAQITLVATDAQGASTRQSFDVSVTSEQRSFREMVGTAFVRDTETDGEPIVGYSWVDTAEDDDTAFDTLLE